MRAIGNIVTGDDHITQRIVDLGVLGPLKSMLSSSQRTAIQKEACWAISNITAGTLTQIQAVWSENIFPILISLLDKADLKTKREACWALCNATSCHDSAPQIIRYLASEGIIRPLCAMLELPDAKILQVALDGIENILLVGQNDSQHNENGINMYAVEIEDVGGMDLLYELQKNADSNVYLKAKNIIDKFYAEEDEEEINVDITGGARSHFSF